MAIHPIEYRYGHPQMRGVWSEESYLKRLVEVEVALAVAEAKCGLIPEDAVSLIQEGSKMVSLKRVKEIESEIDHDMMAVVMALSEQSGEGGKWVHYGATSNDILDTARALQLKEACSLLERDLKVLLGALLNLSREHKRTVCAGRTHGQVGVPTTYGMRFSIWAEEIGRHIERLGEIEKRLLVGKLGGATGTLASLKEDGLCVRREMCALLGLGETRITNQVIQRDRHAEFVMWLAGVSTTLDKMCTEVRNLQRTEIGEVQEAFMEKQVGSSTMPHKRNPIKSEQVCGLARLVRGFVEPALENNVLWDERDLTNSAPERIIFPETCVLTDHLIRTTTGVLKGLKFNYERIKENTLINGGVNLAEAVMLELARKGVGRQKAHELIRECAMRTYDEGILFKEALIDAIGNEITEEELDELLDPSHYTGVAPTLVDAVIDHLKEVAIFE
ncbi:MAG: adenylosuccinate lyase [Methermicoccaceae archaeon]